MAKELDIVVFGATGFTGKHVIPFVHKFSKEHGRSLTWGVAGRSDHKLKSVLTEFGEKLGISLLNIPIIQADVTDEKSLSEMASKARIIINCCGPFRFYGEAVIKACIEQSTHHVDVSGEPQFMESMQLKYHETAKEKGIYIISACGLDSIPADLGVVFLQQQFSGTLNSVQTYLEASGSPNVSGPIVNYGTWESAVYGLAFSNELRGIRSKLFPQRLPSFKPKLAIKNVPHKSDIVDGWVLPFPGSDRSVVQRSQRYFYEVQNKRPVQIGTYFIIKSFISVIFMAVFGTIFGVLTKFEFGRNLLLKYPGFFSCGMFSNQPPSEDTIENSTFTITLYGEGWKEPLANATDEYTTPCNKSIVAKVTGKNPGYGATCISLVLSAIVILTENDKLPSTGGVYPPGYAFAETTLIKQLNEAGVNFEIVSEKDI